MDLCCYCDKPIQEGDTFDGDNYAKWHTRCENQSCCICLQKKREHVTKELYCPSKFTATDQTYKRCEH